MLRHTCGTGIDRPTCPPTAVSTWRGVVHDPSKGTSCGHQPPTGSARRGTHTAHSDARCPGAPIDRSCRIADVARMVDHASLRIAIHGTGRLKRLPSSGQANRCRLHATGSSVWVDRLERVLVEAPSPGIIAGGSSGDRRMPKPAGDTSCSGVPVGRSPTGTAGREPSACGTAQVGQSAECVGSS